MANRILKPLLSAVVATVFTLSASAQVTDAGHPQPSRRGISRQEMLSRRAASTQDKGPGGNYFTGEKHQLVVLAAFANNPFLGDSAATIAQWDKILNTEGLDEAPFAGSLHDYFSDQSYGQFNLVCDLQYVRVDSCRRYRSTAMDDENSQYLVQDVIAALKQRDIRWDRYDWNGDGYVNQLLIIFAGQGSAYGGLGPSYDAIWPHQLWLSMHLKDRQQNVYCSPDTIRYQDKDYVLDAYCAVQEIASDSTYGAFGTLCHEYTHCFGFPDFYSGVGDTPYSWDLMDNGNYNGDGFVPAGYSAHERWLMGWLTPTELTTPTTVTGIPALSDEPVAYIIRNDAYPDEFYMLENRQQKSWDAELPGSGVMIFHIDYDRDLWLTGPVNTYSERHYTVFPANDVSSKASCTGWAYPYETNNALTDTTEPASILWHANNDGKKMMSKPVTDIAVENGLASFTFMSVTTDAARPTVSTQPQKIFRNGQIVILLDGKAFAPSGIELR